MFSAYNETYGIDIGRSELAMPHMPWRSNSGLSTSSMMLYYKVILGMDWLFKHNAMIICKRRKVVFQLVKEEAFEFKDTSKGNRWLVFSAMKVQKILVRGCVGYLASFVNTTKNTKLGISRISPDREIEFTIM